MPDVDDFRDVQLLAVAGHGEFAGAYQLAVLAADAYGLTAIAVDGSHDLLVDTAAQHHLHHIHGLRVGHPHAVDELGVDVELGQQRADLGAAAMDHHGVHADQLHKHHVAGEAFVQGGIDHGIAAELHHYGLAGKALDVRQCLGEYLGDIEGCFLVE